MMKCKYCSEEFESNSILRNHYRWSHNRIKKVNCKFCKRELDPCHLKRHERSCDENPDSGNKCLECGSKIKISRKFCDNSCSAKFNNKAGKTGYHLAWLRKEHPHYNHERGFHYRTICFKKWDKVCAICGWNISLEIHHIDGNHENNNEENLIPLCPNHHVMCKMIVHKKEMDELIKEIVGHGAARGGRLPCTENIQQSSNL
jgi:hypothetical protein